MSIASNLGFPRIGARRELKVALERHWAGEASETELLAQAGRLRAADQARQQGLGVSHIPCNDFSLYDHVLDVACMFGAVPGEFGWRGGPLPLSTYFALARGTAELPALEMTKWFDTNYHYMVPRLTAGQHFELTWNRPLEMFREAQDRHVRTRPVLLGPLSFLLLSKTTDGSDPLDLLGRLVPLYARVLRDLADAGCAWVQMDEPVLGLDLSDKVRTAFGVAYRAFARGATPSILLASYFAPIGDNLPTVLRLPVAGVHLDLIRGRADLAQVLEHFDRGRWLSLGLVDGRNVWRTDLRAALAVAQDAARARGGAERLMIAPSCSLLHVPVDLAQEDQLDPDVTQWLAFGVQKLEEVATIARGVDEGAEAIAGALENADTALRSRRDSQRVHRADVTERLAPMTPEMTTRGSPYPVRRIKQRQRLNLPLFPTTTIGSLPQTVEVRRARAAFGRGDLSAADYADSVERWIADAIALQTRIGLDVLVHGEFERNDMVKYFGERLGGFAFTRHGWVQSYGSRCVAPPIIWGDVTRPAPITLRWARHAQSLTDRPVKGMLTGPVTMLQWSFVRDDMPRELVCRQIALALRDEVTDLETAGLAIIQVDEPAFREGLPLRQADRAAYLRWAVECFRLATSAVEDHTAIHTHMCYAEFQDIMPSIAAMDADAISIETARSRMELLATLVPAEGSTDPIDGGVTEPPRIHYSAEIGPGIWDIHSPRVPDVAELLDLLRLARNRLDDDQIWVNPDCGLKTRGWAEVVPALENLVAAARQLRIDAEQPVDRLGSIRIREVSGTGGGSGGNLAE